MRKSATKAAGQAPGRARAVRRRIMDSATVLFGKYGYAKTTTADIALDLAISKKTIYKYFTTKEDIIRQTAAMHMDEVRNKLDAVMGNASLSVNEKLFGGMRFLAGKLVSIGPFLKGLSKAPASVTQAVIAKRRVLLMGFFKKLFREAIREGLIRKEVDERVFSMLLVTIIDNIFVPELLARMPYSAVTLYRKVSAILLAGILSSAEGEKYLKIMSGKYDEEEGAWNE